MPGITIPSVASHAKLHIAHSDGPSVSVEIYTPGHISTIIVSRDELTDALIQLGWNIA